MNEFFRSLRREILIGRRQSATVINAALFFLMIIVFFPLTLPADPLMLRRVAPGLVWIAALLAMLLASERQFQQDYDNGVLEQWLISSNSLSLIVAAKMLVHWLLIILPILLFCPFLALIYGFSLQEMFILMLSLIVGTPAILGLCSLAAAFSTGMQQKGIFMALILLPLAVPVMIVGSALTTGELPGIPLNAGLAILAALSLAAAGFLPFAIAALIRISLAD